MRVRTGIAIPGPAPRPEPEPYQATIVCRNGYRFRVTAESIDALRVKVRRLGVPRLGHVRLEDSP